MQGSPVRLDAEYWGRGIATREHRRLNGQAPLIVCGPVVGPAGLEVPPGLDVTVDQAAAWPFPQVFRGETRVWVCTETSIRYMSTNAGVTVAVVTGLTAGGGPWTCADFGAWTVFANGAQTVTVRGTTATVHTTVRASIVCNHRGRLVAAGLTGWNEAWAPVLGSLTAPEGFTTALDLGADTVVWFDPAGGDFEAFLDPDPLWLRRLKRNALGWMRSPVGNVAALHPLDTGVLVCGSEGIGKLNPINLNGWPSYGWQTLCRGVAAGRGAINGDGTAALVLDDDWTLWGFENDGMVRLEHVVTGGVPVNPVVTFDDQRREWRVADATRTYMVSGRWALSQVTDAWPGLVRDRRGLVGAKATRTLAIPFVLGTGILDLGKRGPKNLTGIEIGVAGAENLLVTVYNGNGDALLTDAVPTCEGYVSCRLTASEFAVQIEGTAVVAPEYVTLWHDDGKRGVRAS